MELIQKYFHEFDAVQMQKFEQLLPLYQEWNEQINVISRKDMDAFYERHVLHSLAIVKLMKFMPQTDILDVGTGGGFPGIPLAIAFPEVNFLLVDSIGKKIKVVQDVIQRLELKNVRAKHERAEKIKGEFDFIVSRAVTRAERFVPWVQKKIKDKSVNGKPNGFLFLKGGNLYDEFSAFYRYFEIHPIKKYYTESFFETKQIVYLKK